MNHQLLKYSSLIAWLLMPLYGCSETDERKQADSLSQTQPVQGLPELAFSHPPESLLPEQSRYVWDKQPLELPDTRGQKRRLSDWKGSVIMLNFWASWCSPCQFEIPRFVKYQEQYAAQGLQIIGVGLDQAEKLKNVERSLQMNYPTLVISQYDGAALLEQWGNSRQVVPYTVVINQQGVITHTHQGGMDDEDFNEYVLPLLTAAHSL